MAIGYNLFWAHLRLAMAGVKEEDRNIRLKRWPDESADDINIHPAIMNVLMTDSERECSEKSWSEFANACGFSEYPGKQEKDKDNENA